jgi:hypothetical protein
LIRRRRPIEVDVDDELIRSIRKDAADLRSMAEQVQFSHSRMEEIAARMDDLAQRLPTAADDEESE